MRTCHTLLALVRRQLNGPAVVGLLSVVLIFSMVFLPDAQIMVAMNQDGSKGPGGSELSLTAPPMIDTKHAAETFMTTIHGADVSVTYTEEAYDGYNLFVLAEVGTSWSMTLLITDMRGNVVYEKDLGGQEPLADMPIEFINSTTLLGGDTYGAFLHNIYTNQTVRLPIMGHHEYEYNARNNTFFTFVNYDVSINGTLYRYDMLYEYDMLGNITWSLDTQSFIPPSHWCPYREMKGSAGDVTHSNTIFYDDVEDVIYYLSRNTNTMYKINHSDGAVLWGLGEYGDFRQYDEDGHRKHSLFYHAHAVERIDEDTFIIFDNDVHNQDDYSSYSSAMLEIDINESTMTANVSWAWRASKPYWCIRWGDADRLPNGNRLGTFGTEYHLDTNLCARLVEVNNAGQIVWKMDFHRTNNYKYGVYRMERIHFAPILNSPEDLVVDARNPVNLTWSAWYNYRPKRETTGEYNVYLDEVQVDSGNVTFDPYWRPTNIDVSLGVLTHGEKNVTMQIFDEGGHYSTDSVLVNVSGFHVVRHGSTTIETGQEQHTLRWKGFTFNPVFCNITVNGTLHDSFDWNGTDIELDLMSLGLGSHYIELKMFNDSVPIYTDTLWAYVLVSEPPQVISSPGDTVLTWGNTPILTWEVFDNTPDEWQVFVNGTSTGLHEWNIPPTQINWTFPVLDEGIYNVTLMLRDQPGYNVAHTVLVTVLPPPIPIISAQPPDQLVVWGTLGVVFQWEVHGGYSWAVYKNSTILEEDDLSGHIIEIAIEDWYTAEWRPGKYNVTLIVYNETTTAKATTWVEIGVDPGDPYADMVIPENSVNYRNGENAIGAPDELFAEVYTGYEAGYLTLDMGEYESILNRPGDDFWIWAEMGEYSVWASRSLDVMFNYIGYGAGNTRFDLADGGLSSARYVKIVHYDGPILEIDAVEALHYNIPEGDMFPPEITSPGNLTAPLEQDAITVNWTASDVTPWNYSILVDGFSDAAGPWNGSDVFYDFQITEVGMWNVTLVLFDVYGNMAADTIFIEVFRPGPDSLPVELVLVIAGAAGVAVVVVLLLTRRFGWIGGPSTST